VNEDAVNDTFYIVWSPTGHTPPQIKHETRPGAVAEAERLARSNPGHDFYVMAASDMRAVPMKRIKFSDIPF
jgi:hypothetical protein